MDEESAARHSSDSLARIGHFEIFEKLGSGAFGTVWKAFDTRLERVVAIKTPRAGRLDPADAEKFLREARATAQLRHPNIISVYEVGREGELVYIVSDFVEGQSLADWLAERRSSVREAAVLGAKLARALHHAHEAGIIHRDLKPHNILIDDRGEPYLMDFGLARREAGEATLTLDGQLLGTPAYMSPEQARGDAHAADRQSDIYSLGAVLFQLLTGELPFRGNTRMILHQVIHDEPPTPRKLNAHVPRDLETITLKCLEKDPRRRYATAADPAHELDRYLAGEPIEARPIGLAGKAWRWSKRKPALAGALTALVLVLAVGFGGVLSQWRRAEANAREQRRESYYSKIAEAKAHVDRGSIQQAMEVLLSCPEEHRHWEWGHLVQQCHQDIVSIQAGTTSVAQLEFSPDGQRLLTLSVDGPLKVWDWKGDEPQVVFALGDETNRVSLAGHAPDGRYLAVALIQGATRLFSTQDWREVRQFGQEGGRPTAMAWHPDGRQLAIGTARGTINVWDSTTGDFVHGLEGHHRAVTFLSYSPGTERLVSRDETRVCVWDASTGKPLTEFGAELPEGSVVFGDATGSTFAAVDPDNNVRVWCRTGSAARSELPVRMQSDSAHSPPWSGTSSQTLSSLRVPNDKGGDQVPDEGPEHDTQLAPYQAHVLGKIKGKQPGETRRLFFGPDGRWLGQAGEEGTARVWNLQRLEEQFLISTRTHRLVFSPHSRRLAALGEGSVATIWDVEKGQVLKTLKGHSEIIERSAFDHRGELVATADAGGTVKIWTAGPGREVIEELSWVPGLSISPDDRLIGVPPFGRGLMIVEAESGIRRLTIRPYHEWIMRTAFSPDGRRIATVGSRKAVTIYDVASGQVVLQLKGQERQGTDVAYAPDGSTLAASSLDGLVRIWDAEAGGALGSIDLRPDQPWYLAYVGSSGRLLVGGLGPFATVWDVKSQVRLMELPGHRGESWDVIVSRDGRFMATLDGQSTVRVWRAETGGLLRQWPIRGYRAGLAFSPDGERLAAISSKADFYGSEFCTIELWDVATGRQVLTVNRHTDTGRGIEFSRDGLSLVTGATDFRLCQTEAFLWNRKGFSGPAALGVALQTDASRYWRRRMTAELATGPDRPADGITIELPFDRRMIPARDSRATSRQVDLSEHYTDLLTETFHPCFSSDYQDHDFRELPSGLVEFGGRMFDVRGVIQLKPRSPLKGPWQLNWDLFPAQSTGIKVERFERLHVLHAGVLSPGEPSAVDGKVVAVLVCHYANGTDWTIEVVYGRHLREWEQKPGAASEVSDGKVVWRGADPVTEQLGTSLRLYEASWDNPLPGEVVRGIDYVSGMTAFAPFLIAITAE